MHSRIAAVISSDLPRRFLANPLLPVSSGDVKDPLGFGSGDGGGTGESVDGSNVAEGEGDRIRLGSGGLEREGERKGETGLTGCRKRDTKAFASHRSKDEGPGQRPVAQRAPVSDRSESGRVELHPPVR